MTTVAQSAASWAQSRIGMPYESSPDKAMGPRGFDCSGLIVAAYRAAGGFLLRHNTVWLRRDLQSIAHYSLLRPGDVVFYYDNVNPSHCAIYVGRTGVIGKRKYWVVQATNQARGVEKIEMNAYTRAVAYGRVRRGGRTA